MKKLLTLLLCLVFAISAFAMCGCKDKIFEGRYSVATDKQIQSIVNTTHYAENGETFDYNGGLQITCSANIYDGADYIDFYMNFQSLAQGDNLMMQGEARINTSLDDYFATSAKIYYSDGYAYTAYDTSEGVEKYKERISATKLLAEYMELVHGYNLTLEQMYTSLRDEEGVTWYIAESKLYNKVKVEIVYSDEYETIVSDVVYVYDINYQLIALSIDVVSTDTITENGTTSTISIVIKPWLGLIILPTDLDTYE